MPTFKFRGGQGIELISAAVKKDDGSVVSKFRVKTDGEYHDVAYYDTHIASENIRNIRYRDGEVILTVQTEKDGPTTEIVLPTNVNTNDIALPEDAEDGEIALYGVTEDGTRYMKKSSLKITTEVEKITSADETNDSVPTSWAINKLMNQTFDPLGARSLGENVKSINIDED
jgi:hypothetical protein